MVKTPDYMLGLVVQCDEATLDLYHEFTIYSTARTERVSQTKRADWIAFKIDEDRQVLEMRPIPRRWGSVVDSDGDIRLTVNALIRDVIDYPILNYADGRVTMPSTRPWSFELDWLDDPRSLMSYRRGVREGWMHEVVIKFIQKDDDEDKWYFPIVEVHYESPDEMQLNSFYAPWVEDVLVTMITVGDERIPIRDRETGKLHPKNRLNGIIMRGNPVEQRYYIWSKESGMLYISTYKENFVNMQVGQYAYFKVKTRYVQKDLVAHSLVPSPNVVKETKIIDGPQNQIDAALKTQFRIPPADRCGNYIEQVDVFLGLIRISTNLIERKLSEIGMSMEKVYGKTIWIWVSAKFLVVDDQRGAEPRFWSFDHLDDDLFVEDGF